MAEDQDNFKSKYNEAELQIMRLHDKWVLASNYISMANLAKWKETLDLIWLELRADVEKRSDGDKIKTENTKLKREIIKAQITKSRAKIYFALYKWHEFLKILQDKVGKGAKYTYYDDSEY